MVMQNIYVDQENTSKVYPEQQVQTFFCAVAHYASDPWRGVVPALHGWRGALPFPWNDAHLGMALVCEITLLVATPLVRSCPWHWATRIVALSVPLSSVPCHTCFMCRDPTTWPTQAHVGSLFSYPILTCQHTTDLRPLNEPRGAPHFDPLVNHHVTTTMCTMVSHIDLQACKELLTSTINRDDMGRSKGSKTSLGIGKEPR